MGRSTELRRKLNETQKSTVKSGLNGELQQTYQDGSYIVSFKGKLSLLHLEAADAWDHYAKGAQLQLIPENLAKAIEKAANVNETALKEFAEHHRLHKEGKVTKETSFKVSDNEELKTSLEAVARVGVSLAGIYADLGAKAETKLSIKGKTLAYDARLFAEVKAGVRAGLLGVSAQISAEAAAEHKVSATVKKITTKAGTEVRLELYFSIKGFAKAEAYAGIGLATTTGAQAFAGIGVEAKLGGDVFRKKTTETKEINAGGVSTAFTVKAGALVGATAGLNIQEVFKGDKPYTEFKISISAGFLVGASFAINGLILSELFEEAKDEITQKIKKIVGEEFVKQIEEELQKVKEELEYHVQDSARKLRRGWDNTQNYGSKLLIAIEEGLGHHQKAMHDEIKRQVEKLHQYKRELTGVISKFDQLLGNDDNLLDQILDEVTDPAFKKRVDEWFGDDQIEHRALKKELMLDLERYEQRIVKLNEFLDKSYQETLKDVTENLQNLRSMITTFQSKDIPTNFKDSKDYQKMVKKIGDVQDMIGSIEHIIGEKRKLLKEVKEQQSLRALIAEMGKQYQKIKADFYQLNEILTDYVDNLPQTK